jgi:hypothetical protein
MVGMFVGVPLLGMILSVAFVVYLNLTGQIGDDDDCGSDPAVIESRPQE